MKVGIIDRKVQNKHYDNTYRNSFGDIGFSINNIAAKIDGLLVTAISEKYRHQAKSESCYQTPGMRHRIYRNIRRVIFKNGQADKHNEPNFKYHEHILGAGAHLDT